MRFLFALILGFIATSCIILPFTNPLNRIPMNGGQYFLLGADYPWLNYGNDFGSNAFGTYGFSTNSQYNTDFANMAGTGIHVARFWVFADGRAGINFDSTGTPTGLQPQVFTDFDMAVTVAKQNNIYLIPTIFDFSLFKTAQISGGVQLGGHSDVFTDDVKRTALINTVISPLLQRYADESTIVAWDLMNEPEFSISDLPQPAVNSGIDPITSEQFFDYLHRASAIAHDNNELTTLGSASLKWNQVWTNAYAVKKNLPTPDLDIYQTHYYPWMDGITIQNDPDLGTTSLSPITQPVIDLHLDHPIIVGESIDSSANRDAVLANGYAGFLAWSFNSSKTGDGLTLASDFSSWESSHAALVRLPNLTTVTPTATPSSTSTVVVTPTNTSTVTPTVTVTATATLTVTATATEISTVTPTPTATVESGSGTTFTPCATSLDSKGHSQCGNPIDFCNTWIGGHCNDYRTVRLPPGVEQPFGTDSNTAADISCLGSTNAGQAFLPYYLPTNNTENSDVAGYQVISFPCGFESMEHFMTRIEDGQFGMVVMRQQYPFDFSGRTGHIHFDIDLKTLERRYPRLVLSPQLTQTGIDDRSMYPVVNNAFDLWFRNGTFQGRETKNGVVSDDLLNPCNGCGSRYYGTDNARDSVDVYISRTHIKIVVNSVTEIDTDIPDLGFDVSYVYLEHVNYNSCKAYAVEGYATVAECQVAGNTFHWDNIAWDGPVLPKNSLTPSGYEDVTFNAFGQASCTVQGIAAYSQDPSKYIWATWVARLPAHTSVANSDVVCTPSSNGGQWYDGVPMEMKIVQQ